LHDALRIGAAHHGVEPGSLDGFASAWHRRHWRLADSDNLPPPDVIAQEIVDDLEAALEQFRLIAGDLGEATAATGAD